jgi:hypothetical protein
MAGDGATPDHETFHAKPKIEFHHEGTKDAKKSKKKNWSLSFLRALRAFVVNAFVCFTLILSHSVGRRSIPTGPPPALVGRDAP